MSRKIKVNGVLYEAVGRKPKYEEISEYDLAVHYDAAPCIGGKSLICRLASEDTADDDGDVEVLLAKPRSVDWDGSRVEVIKEHERFNWSRVGERHPDDPEKSYREAYALFKNVVRTMMDEGLEAAKKKYRLRRR